MNQDQLLLMPNLGQFSKRYRVDVAYLRDFRKVGFMNQDSLYKKATRKDLGGPASRFSGNHQVGASSVRLMEIHIWHLPASTVRGKAQQRNNGLCQHFLSGRKLSPQLLSDARKFNSSPNVSGVFLSCFLSPSKFVCVGPLRGML